MTQRVLGVLTVLVSLLGFVGLAWAPPPASVRVVNGTQILSRPSADGEVVRTADVGTTLDVVDSDRDWYLVSLTPDSNGARRRGWIQAKDVEVVTSVHSDALRTDSPATGPMVPPPPPSQRQEATRPAELSPRTPMPAATPSPLPSARSASAAAEVISLKAVHRIFVDQMSDDLDQYINAEITKQLKGRVTIVLNKADADAILRGTGESKTGVGAAITGRYLGLHDNATGSVSLIDRDEKVVLWSSEAGDRSIWWGAMARGGQRKVADRLVHDLKSAIEKAR